ncbi:Uncharacterized PI3/PI4-kinase family protein C1F5.11c [Listeria monocytogenes N53-1]|nr:Uncharacterized PI3/PI4-kinase family protein C1F5.11c [Listeria monocytogenes N53-1]
MTDGTIIKTDQVTPMEQAKAFLESVTEVEVDGLQKAFKSMKSTRLINLVYNEQLKLWRKKRLIVILAVAIIVAIFTYASIKKMKSKLGQAIGMYKPSNKSRRISKIF